MILVVDHYDSFTYNLVQLIEGFRRATEVVKSDELPAAELVARGAPKAKLVPVERLDDLEREGAAFAGFAAGEIGQGPHSPDMASLPDWSSLLVVPWRREIAWVAGDVHVEGQSWPSCPRSILRRQMDLARQNPIFREHVTFLHGSSVDPAIVEEVHRRAEGRRVMIILDSLHTEAHVTAELDAYADLVSPGCYLIVQDGFVNGHPLEPTWGPGPYEATERFLERDSRFEQDRDRERMLFTFNPGGFLRRSS